jgi:hypothetical protein
MQREPELIVDNEDLWNFVRFAGEDHNTYRTLVAFLNMLTALVRLSSEIESAYRLHNFRQFIFHVVNLQINQMSLIGLFISKCFCFQSITVIESYSNLVLLWLL